MTTTPATKLKLSTGMKVYFEEENYQGNGTIHYIPTQDECKKYCFMEIHGENCISVKPKNGRPRFVPVSQIVIL